MIRGDGRGDGARGHARFSRRRAVARTEGLFRTPSGGHLVIGLLGGHREWPDLLAMLTAAGYTPLADSNGRVWTSDLDAESDT